MRLFNRKKKSSRNKSSRTESPREVSVYKLVHCLEVYIHLSVLSFHHCVYVTLSCIPLWCLSVYLCICLIYSNASLSHSFSHSSVLKCVYLCVCGVFKYSYTIYILETLNLTIFMDIFKIFINKSLKLNAYKLQKL